jgi:succinate-semialdehyde dehydrogenase/glutarate-semialdehyde dehydrogenase
MLQDPRVRALSFTGSTEVGKVLLSLAAANVVKCSMELGGNAPFIILDDADLEAAVDGLMVAKMRNGGAACTAANRVFVQRGIARALTERFIARMAQVGVGPGLDPRSDIGPMVSQIELARVTALVQGAIGVGATVHQAVLGAPADGYYYPPTVLTGVDADSAILAEEIFGPVAPIVQFDSVEEVVALANNTHSGLAAYLYTTNLTSGLAISRRLQTGMVGLNQGLVSDPAAPFGGVKSSGLGREGSNHGIHEFLETKYIATPYV